MSATVAPAESARSLQLGPLVSLRCLRPSAQASVATSSDQKVAQNYFHRKCVPESARIDGSSAQVQLRRPPWSRWALEGPQPREPSEGAPCARLPLPLVGPWGTPSTCVGLCAPLSVWTQVSWGTDSFPAPFSTWPCGASLQLKVFLVREGHKEVAWQSSGTPPTPVHNGHLAPFKATPNKAEYTLK